MKTNIVALTLIVLLNCSCSKNNPDVSTGLKEISVEKVTAEAETNIDISGRSNWTLVVHRNYYKSRIEGATIFGEQSSAPFKFLLDNTSLEQPLVPDEEPGIFFFSLGYINNPEGLNVKEGPLPYPNISDQDTREKLIAADMLFGKYSGIPDKQLNNIKLRHANALLDFEITGLPEISEVKIVELGKPIIPFSYHENQFQAVVSGDWVLRSPILIAIKTGETVVQQELFKKEDIKGNMRYSFSLQYDQNVGKVIVSDIKPTTWGNEKWPGDNLN